MGVRGLPPFFRAISESGFYLHYGEPLVPGRTCGIDIQDDLVFVENDSTRIFSTRSIVNMKAISKRFAFRYVMQETLR